MLTQVFTVALALGTASARLVLPEVASKWHAPDFCHDKECPVFKNLTKNEPYNVRDYRASTWVAYDAGDKGFVAAQTAATLQLTRYFKGANVKDAHIDLTTPAITKFIPTDADFSGSKNNYTVAYYLPHAAPKPQVDAVYLLDLPAATAYVRSFGGYATEGSILAEAKTLRDQLLHDKVDIEEHIFFYASYDSAARLINRHNEVWFAPARASIRAPVTAAAEQSQAVAGSLVDAVYHRVKALLG